MREVLREEEVNNSMREGHRETAAVMDREATTRMSINHDLPEVRTTIIVEEVIRKEKSALEEETLTVAIVEVTEAVTGQMVMIIEAEEVVEAEHIAMTSSQPPLTTITLIKNR